MIKKCPNINTNTNLISKYNFQQLLIKNVKLQVTYF